MRMLTSCIVALALIQGAAWAQPSQIVYDTMPVDYISVDVTHDIPLKIYLPPDHSPTADPYRVYIYLHGGASHNYNTYSATMKAVLDELINAGTIDPIVVIWPNVQWPGIPDPDGNIERFYNLHFYTDSSRNGDYESVITTDLLAWLQDPAQHATPYNLSTNSNKYAIGGFSMGGAACIRIGARHLDKFAVCASQSGSPAYQLLVPGIAQLLAEYPGGPPYDWNPDRGWNSTWYMAAGAAFSPNPNGNLPLWGMDFSVDSATGEIIPEIFYDIWIAEHDPIELLKPLKEPGEVPGDFVLPIALYFDVRSAGPNLPWNERFDDDLTAEGVVGYEYNIWSGGGHVLMGDAVEGSLIFIDLTMDELMTGVQPPSLDRNYFELSQNHPNPFNPMTTIRYSLDSPQQVRMAVYGVEGRLVTTLVRAKMAAGSHEVSWNGCDSQGQGMPSGSYLVRLETEYGVQAKKISLIR